MGWDPVLFPNDVPGGWEHVPSVPCSEHVLNVPTMFQYVLEHLFGPKAAAGGSLKGSSVATDEVSSIAAQEMRSAATEENVFCCNTGMSSVETILPENGSKTIRTDLCSHFGGLPGPKLPVFGPKRVQPRPPVGGQRQGAQPLRIRPRARYERCWAVSNQTESR